MYGRDEREEIGNQGEENVKAILAHHFGQEAIQNVDGQDGHPDIYLVTPLGRMAVEVKSMLPFSIDKNHKGKKVHKVGYAHINRTSWRFMNEFAHGKITAISVIIEVRFRHLYPYIYFLLKREDIEDWNINVKKEAEWVNIPLWYIHERGIGFNMDIPPEFDWTPLDTNQVQMEEITIE